MICYTIEGLKRYIIIFSTYFAVIYKIEMVICIKNYNTVKIIKPKMKVIITITGDIPQVYGNRYDYGDRILKNIESRDYEVFYSGQNQGRLDYQLLNAVDSSSTFGVYHRSKKTSPFTFWGITNDSSIVRERSIANGVDSLPNERLQIRLVIPCANVIKRQINTEFTGTGKYKKAVLQHSGFDIDVNINLGFYTKI